MQAALATVRPMAQHSGPVKDLLTGRVRVTSLSSEAAA
jgi:hypothetical protein